MQLCMLFVFFSTGTRQGARATLSQQGKKDQNICKEKT